MYLYLDKYFKQENTKAWNSQIQNWYWNSLSKQIGEIMTYVMKKDYISNKTLRRLQ